MDTIIQVVENHLEQQLQFKAARAKIIGGSDIHSVHGLQPYGCPRKTSYDKQGIHPDHPFNGNPNTERGSIMEPVAALVYKLRYNLTLVRDGFTGHPQRAPDVGLSPRWLCPLTCLGRPRWSAEVFEYFGSMMAAGILDAQGSLYDLSVPDYTTSEVAQ